MRHQCFSLILTAVVCVVSGITTSPSVAQAEVAPNPLAITNGLYFHHSELTPVAVIIFTDRRGNAVELCSGSLIGNEPVDLYSQVDRAIKYGFLFIGFTFVAFLMFDIIAGARVAPAEYLLTGVALVLFFVLLLAFAEVIGFTFAYMLASAAIIGLLAFYSAAVLKSWKRARFLAAMLVGLYALLYVLLNLEAYSLLIGSVLMFFALAGVMYMTRSIDWSGLGKKDEVAA